MDNLIHQFNSKSALEKKRATAFLFFNFVFGLMLIACIFSYALFIPEHFYFAAPPSLIGLVCIAVCLVILKRGSFTLAASFFTLTLGIVLLLAQFCKFLGDPETAYSSFIFLFPIPIIFAGLFNSKKMILTIAGLMIISNISFYISLSIIHSTALNNSHKIGFISSLLLLLLSGKLVFLTRQILDSLIDNLADLNKSLQRFVPAEFLKQLDKESVKDLSLGDKKLSEMSILFCDIRGYTSLAESSGSEQTFELLNSYYSKLAPVIKANHGFIDKYVGDAVMALFPQPGNAVQCAKEMVSNLSDFNAESKHNIQMGIGIETGVVVIGAMGEQERIDTTVIGSAVNTSARLEELTYDLNRSIVIGRNTFLKLNQTEQSEFDQIDEVKIKGLAAPISVYALE